MSGHILLEGGAEFGGEMAAPDRRALELAGGRDALVCVLPTAAAPDNNQDRAGSNAARWFARLGARQVQVLSLVDTASAADTDLAGALRQARLIYLLGGFPGYLERTLAGSLSWQAVLEAYASGAVVGGSSAGAMVLCDHYYDPYEGRLAAGLGLVSNSLLLPHHNAAGRRWVGRLAGELPGVTRIGIDERTGALDDAPNGAWTVYGAGAVTLYRTASVETYRSGETFSLEE